MPKRENPRLWMNKETSGKNKRSAHTIGRDGRLSKTSAPKSEKRGFGKSEGSSRRDSFGYSSRDSKSEFGAKKNFFSKGSAEKTERFGKSGASRKSYSESSARRTGRGEREEFAGKKTFGQHSTFGKSESFGGKKSFGKAGSFAEKKSFARGDGRASLKGGRTGYAEKKAEQPIRGRRNEGFESARKASVEKFRSRREGFEQKPEFDNPNLLIGRNPVAEAIKSGRTIDKILMQKDGEGSIKKIASQAREAGIQIQYVDKIVLDKLAPGRPHQGIAAYAAAHDYVELEDIFKAAEEKGEDPFIVVLDNLEDPHNLGAILRSADGAGAHGIVIPSRRSVSLTETVAKASAGAIEYVPVAKVNNLASAIDTIKEHGVWVAAVDMDGEDYHHAKLSGPIAVVIGSEGQGVSRLVKEKCDFVVSIPMKGKVNSLNASNAAAVILYEAEYQRNNG